jgi:hypothetical protein
MTQPGFLNGYMFFPVVIDVLLRQQTRMPLLPIVS